MVLLLLLLLLLYSTCTLQNKTYFQPYRRVLDANSCILCGKGRGRKSRAFDICTCESMTVCVQCDNDNRQVYLTSIMFHYPVL